jgi:hypothetical protein
MLRGYQVDPKRVREVSKALVDMGCYEVSLGDTVGMARPWEVREVVEEVKREVDVSKLAVCLSTPYSLKSHTPRTLYSPLKRVASLCRATSTTPTARPSPTSSPPSPPAYARSTRASAGWAGVPTPLAQQVTSVPRTCYTLCKDRNTKSKVRILSKPSLFWMGTNNQ